MGHFYQCASESISMSSVVLRSLPSCPPSMKRVPFGRTTLEANLLAWSMAPTCDQELLFKAKQAVRVAELMPPQTKGKPFTVSPMAP